MSLSSYIKKFSNKVRQDKRKYKIFLTKIENGIFPSYGKVELLAEQAEIKVWEEIDCINCAKCCKNMTPTFKKKEIKIIAKHFNISQKQFIDKWLYKDKTGDWLNKKTPCQFLDKNNFCTIYDIRPEDCRGFPHLQRKPLKHYAHSLKQNIEHCPATFMFVEKLREKIKKHY